jgi:hypothetical protein
VFYYQDSLVDHGQRTFTQRDYIQFASHTTQIPDQYLPNFYSKNDLVYDVLNPKNNVNYDLHTAGPTDYMGSNTSFVNYTMTLEDSGKMTTENINQIF